MLKTAQVIFFIFVATFLIISLTKNFFSYRDKVSFYNNLQHEYNKEEDRNKKLKSDLKRGTDYFYIERQIREKLNLLHDDETAVIIPAITPTPIPTPVIKRKPHEQWLQLVTKKQSL